MNLDFVVQARKGLRTAGARSPVSLPESMYASRSAGQRK